MNARLALALVPLVLAACGSGGSGGTATTDTADFAGLWRAGEFRDGAWDERYVSISTDGRLTEYDYRQDGHANEGNCYAVAEFGLERTASRDVDSGLEIGVDGSLTDADPITVEGAPTFRLSDGRTISLFAAYGYPPAIVDTSGETVEIGPTDFLIGRIDDRTSSRSFQWMPAAGLSTTDLTPCDDG